MCGEECEGRVSEVWIALRCGWPCAERGALAGDWPCFSPCISPFPPLLSLFQNFDQVTLRAATGLVAGGIPTAGCYVRKSLNTLTQLTVSPEDLCLSPPLLQSISSIDPLIIAEQQAVARTRRGQQHRRRPLVYSARVRRCGPVYLAPRRSPSWPFVSPPPRTRAFSRFFPLRIRVLFLPCSRGWADLPFRQGMADLLHWQIYGHI